MKKWTDEQIQEILDLRIIEEWTARRIADKMGTTRNAIIGIWNRHAKRKFKGKNTKVTKKILKKGNDAIKGKTYAINEKVNIGRKSPTKVKKQIAIIGSLPVAMMELKEIHCRFPVDDHKFCGAKKEKGSYCAHHYQISYVKPRYVGAKYEDRLAWCA